MTQQMKGKFGPFGGQYVAETLMPALQEVEKAFEEAWGDPTFHQEYQYYLKHYVGRPSPLYFAERLTQSLGGAKIYLKREDLNHTGAHKINNTIGQILLAKRMGKRRVIAETGAGMHGVATATACALFGLTCEIFMGAEDIRRQNENVKRMRYLGAKITSVTSGTGTLKDAMNEALRNWVSTVSDTFYCIGSVAGPHPYPSMVRTFQQIIGEETRWQILDLEGRLPNYIIACVGGGSNAMGIFAPFLKDTQVHLVGVEAAGQGIHTGHHAASICAGKIGILHGSKTYLLQDQEGQVHHAFSISAGLDYPGVGPEHAWLHQTGRVTYVPVTDAEAVYAFQKLTREEGIIPALESAHAVAEAIRRAPSLSRETLIIVNLSGRGDKDMMSVIEYLESHPNERI